MLGGGKRLRPSFCHWGFVGAGGDPGDQRIVDAGAALELMHAFALFHDDVMDDAVSRRGTPTTHTVFAEAHAAAGWAGESRRFGEGVAILVGDLAFVMADELLIDAPHDAWVIWNESAHRAQHRPTARHRRQRARRSTPRQGRADLSLQERQVHRRATAAPRRGARRARAGRASSCRR